ncbi:BMP family ABC transporter substrate-binding protein [Nocardia jiangxiensis]|uniref:BMP family ABC transporter substrate-binding protein n=1 Tax=Nocardia jiangxiensis TaxID=282685 RepID=UPI00146BFCA8|nr:BMP family ABC transporter substrate-binding protein [Nocardia jiangxiensis]
MAASSARVGVAVPAADRDEGWVGGAWHAVDRLTAAGLEVEAAVGDVPREWLGPTAPDVVVLHGIQYYNAALELLGATESAVRSVILSDVPLEYTDGTSEPPPGLTLVDWRWWVGAEHAGRAAAAETAGPIGFVAGPAVPTQRRTAAAFVRGVSDVDERRSVVVVHLPDFRDVDRGAATGEHLARHFGCGLVAHSADEAGAAATAAARALGATTYGFLTPVGDDAASIRSAIAPVLENLVRTAVAGTKLPGIHTCTWEAGEIWLERAPS